MPTIKRSLKKFVDTQLNKRGYYDVRGLGYELCTIGDFRQRARAIMARFDEQDEDMVATLRQKYEKPILGEVSVYRLLELLAQIIDPTNYYLYCGSQLTHTLQALESMERAGITDRELIATTLIHDLGKLAFLKGELPEYVEGGGKRPLRKHEPVSVWTIARSRGITRTSFMRVLSRTFPQRWAGCFAIIPLGHLVNRLWMREIAVYSKNTTRSSGRTIEPSSSTICQPTDSRNTAPSLRSFSQRRSCFR